MIDVNDYTELKECVYKGEHYSVRDNGSIMRHSRDGKPVRKMDNQWTFGKPCDKTGYMNFCGERVHRIIAMAFHGNPPTEKHVVDHIDTNRRNNRPENLRWVTRLENALNNPITRARIENICGSIEAFLENPSILRGHENIDRNFDWMRTVTKEEARTSLETLTKWAKERPEPKGGHLGEWIYHPQWRNNSNYHVVNYYQEERPTKTQSLTPNVIQVNWRTPCEFPLCPQSYGDNPLETYMNKLEVGKKLTASSIPSKIVKFWMPEPDCLFVLSELLCNYGLVKITFDDGIFYHEYKGAYDIGDFSTPEEVYDFIVNYEDID